MFRKLKRLYKDIVYVDGLDENIINRYCLIHAETVTLGHGLVMLSNRLEEVEEFTEKIEIMNQINNITNTVYKLREMLLKIEDRLLLNPTARIKNVPKKVEEEKKSNKFDKFRSN